MGPTLVLTGAGPLDADCAARAAQAAGCDAPRALGATAAEAAAPDLDPRRLAAARAALSGAPVDANLVPRRGLPRLLICDMDSTVIGCECIDEIADVAGVGAQVAAVTERAMQGALDFEAALVERMALLAGLDAAALERVWAERVRLNPGAETLVRTLAGLGVETALVSGGFTFFTERVAAAAGFASHAANTLEIADGRLTGRVVPPILGRDAKAQRLAALAEAGGFGAEAVVAVGDGANDLAMIRAAGLGVAYRAKPVLADAADARIDHADLTAALHLVGVAETDWVAA
ncbi:MAG: phosphoserine phosphatase SerB [Rhodobacteraceae bacterium]|nr:MAG: phosphoserine phosphatase SerB [Paracoccaceae bacterium]